MAEDLEARSQSHLTISELHCHAYARYLIYLLNAPTEYQLKLRPYCFLRFLPPEIYKNKKHPVPWETERELAIFLYRHAPPQKVRWLFIMPARFILEQLNEDEQWRLLVILEKFYGRT